MVQDALVVAQQVAVLFLLIGVGFFCAKFKILREEGAKQMTTLLLYIIFPAVIINTLAIPFDATILGNMGWALGIALLVKIIGIGLGYLMFRKTEYNDKVVYRYAMVLGSNTFFGFPLVQAFLGDEAMIYVVMSVIALNFFVWTHGLMTMAGKGSFSVKKLFVNPGMIGTFAALIIFFFSIPLPMPVRSSLGFLASTNAAIAMIILGVFLANANFKDMIMNKGIYLVSFMRLIAIPLIVFVIIRPLGLSPLLMQTMMIIAALPSAVQVSMFSVQFNRNAKLSGEMVSFVTLCSIITIPLITLITQMLS